MASASSHTTSSNKWREIVQQYYPDALSRTYTVPPVHFNHVPLTLDTVPGTSHLSLVQQSVGQSSGQQAVRHPSGQQAVRHPSRQQAVRYPSGQQAVMSPPPAKLNSPASQPPSSSTSTPPQASTSIPPPPPPPSQPPQVMWPHEQQVQSANVYEGHLRFDLAQARVVRNLEELGRHREEKMFILSEFLVDNYLNKFQYQAAIRQLPHPKHLGIRCEFDVLTIHRQHGILIGEVSPVGHNYADLMMTKAHEAMVKNVQKALKQLARKETVVRHMLGDFNPPLTVRAALFLPNVTRAQLHRILTANPQLEKAACQRLGAADATQAAKLCCTANDVSPRDAWWEITPAVLTKLTTWWEGRMDSVDPAMSDEIYLDIVARFVGPASSVTVYTCGGPRVEVRTESDAVAELGWRLSRLVLTPQQWDLTSRHLPLMYLTGPPGSGKTLQLVMMGVNWVQNGKDTYVVSVRPGTFAISTMIAKQVQITASATAPAPSGNVLLRHYDFVNDNTAAARAVSELSAAAQGGAAIIMDEVDFDTSNDRTQRTYNLIEQLIRQVPGLHLWCAGIRHDTTPPSGLQVEVLTTPLRNAPAILREVEPTLRKMPGVIHMYSDNGIPAPGDGQRVRHLRHEGGAHTGRWPVDCEQCGRDVAAELRQLRVGVPSELFKRGRVAYRDVFILSRSNMQDEERNNVGMVTSPACGIVRGVRGAGMPVNVVRRDRAFWEREMEDVATAETDSITAVYWGDVIGLERKVVVWLHGRRQDDDHLSDEDIDDMDRLGLVTRCTTQLVVVDVPP